jgi:DNA-binding XRE family transcriptional regulator
MRVDGAAVRALRTQADLTQEQLAVKVGIAKATVQTIERGSNLKPTLLTIRSIAAALGVEVEDITVQGERTEASA